MTINAQTTRLQLRPTGRLIGLLMTTLAGIINLSPALAENTSTPHSETNAAIRLQQVTQEIEQRKAKAVTYQLEIATLQTAYRTLQKKLVETASAIRESEQSILALEARMDTLNVEEQQVSFQLRNRSAELAGALAIMQRLSRRPTALLIARPTNMKTTAQTALLLDTIMPSLASQANTLRHDIDRVAALRATIADDRKALLLARHNLEARQREMNILTDEQKAKQKAYAAILKEERARISALATEAKSLGELLAGLQELTTQGTTSGPIHGGSTVPAPGRLFSASRGSLPLPVRGIIVGYYSERENGGRRQQGIRIETAPSAPVMSPWDGSVIFSGPFRDYGQLLIIAHGEGYHTLFAGMAQINVDITQWVLAGEPVGLMSPVTSFSAKVSKPRLYIELRLNGRSINPLPWIAARERKVKG